MQAPDPAALLDLALDTALAAADLVREHRAGDVTVAATKSSDVDVVTAADRASEQLIHDRLLAARPGDAFLGEESGSHETGAADPVRWIVDPIDGTVNFLYGIPQYAVSIAAEHRGTVVAGVVVNVATREVFTALRGIGAWRDGVPLATRPVPPQGQQLVLTGFGYDADRRAQQAAAVGRMLPRIRDIRRIGAAALDLCAVAAGEADAYVEEGLNPWDDAAGGLVAREAGATVTVGVGADGGRLVVCAPQEGFAAFARLVADCGFGTVGAPE